MAADDSHRATLSGKRRSVSSEASRKAELERLWKMTALERMALALALGRERRSLATKPPAPGDDPRD